MAPPPTMRSGNRAIVVDSKNRVMATGRELKPKPPRQEWGHTRTALEQLENQLLCSLCVCILEEPVCLGGCEHVFCRKCVGPSVGNECPVCHMPAWVKDVQINRQLANMIQLCKKLHDVLDGVEQPAEKKKVCTPVKANHVKKAEPKKKQIRMWFSPRSGKVKCVLDQVPKLDKTVANGDAIYKDAIYQEACSTFAFSSSSPPSPSPPPKRKKPTPKAKSKKKQLADINQKWGFGTKKGRGTSDAKKQSNDDGIRPQEERVVSFCSQPVVLCSPEYSPIEEEALKMGLAEELTPSQNGSVCHVELSIQANPVKDCTDSLPTLSLGSEADREATTPAGSRSKRGRKPSQAHFSASPASKRRGCETPSAESEIHRASPDHSLLRSPESKPLRDCMITVAQISSPAAELKVISPPAKICMARVIKDIGSPCHLKLPPSPATPTSRTRSQADSLCLSPINLGGKRNFKGETPLHIASIKGEISAVEELLKNGADPNVKDYAGWTPLHEACNHGHEKVVDLLLQHRALVNTTGYQNDSPLHDAAKNGHVAIVKLLLAHGASRDAVNIFGLLPADYAETEEIKSALLLPSIDRESLSSRPCIVPVSMSQQREGRVVLMASGLSSSQQKNLGQLAGILKAGKCTEFNSTVSHIIVPGEGALSTMKVMMGILAGCWVLKFQWVQTCLASKTREPEEEFEMHGGPQRGRLNRENLLPNLLDGCYFYFLGSFKSHRKEDLTELVKAAGGQVLARQPKPDSDVTQTINTVAYHAEANSDQSFCTQYIIYDKSSSYRPERVRQGKVWTAPSSWLIESITSFQLLPVTSEGV